LIHRSHPRVWAGFGWGLLATAGLLASARPALAQIRGPEHRVPPAALAHPALRGTGASVPGAATPSVPVASPSIGAASPSATTSVPVDEGPKFYCADIQVRGNQSVTEETILLTLPIHAGMEVSRAQVMESLQRIYGLGYFRDVKAATEPVMGGERLIFNVVENPVLRAVSISGVAVFPRDKVEKPFDAMKGRIINLKDIQTAIKDLEKQYADKGYVLARVVDLQVQPDGLLEIKIAEGVIHAIKIAGNDETQDYVIRREITLKPGQLYNLKTMQDDLRRVYNLNFFEDIGIKYEPAAQDPSQVDVIVSVKEKQTGTFQLSAGWSNQDGPLGIMSLRKDNLFGRGQTVGVDLTVSRNAAAELNYFNPWIDQQHTSLGVGGYYRQYYNYFANFLEHHGGGVVSLGRPLFGQDPVTAQWRGAARLRVERIDLLGSDGVNYTRPLDTVTATPLPQGQPVPAGERGYDFFTAAGYTVTFDSRDYLLNPSTGWFNTYSIEQYVPGLGNVSLSRLQLDINRFFPLWFGHTLALDWKLGTLLTPFGGNVPPYERFYSTGAYLIRGWSENPSPPEVANARALGIPYDGSSFTLGSIEYRFPIVSILSGVVFGDSGIFWDQSAGNFAWSRDRSGYGVGIRVNTPLGPLRLDYGLHTWGQAGQIHFSIGQKF